MTITNTKRIVFTSNRYAMTLIEILLTVVIITILATMAIPRIGLDTIGRVSAETSAVKFSNYLYLAKSLSITNASTKPLGYKIVLLPSSPYTSYRLLDTETLALVKPEVIIPQGVVVTGNNEFQFETLGDMTGSQTKQVNFTKNQKSIDIFVYPLGGRIEVIK